MTWVLSFYAVAAFVAATALGLGIMLVMMLFGDEYRGYTPVDGDELRRIVEEDLGGITFEAEVRHSRITLTARTGEDEEVKALQLD